MSKVNDTIALASVRALRNCPVLFSMGTNTRGDKTLKIGVPRETAPGECRIALIPEGVAALKKAGFEVFIESGAGESAGLLDAAYQDRGATILPTRAEVFAQADVILQVRAFGANLDKGRDDFALYRPGQSIVALVEPLAEAAFAREGAEKGIQIFSMELMPRITRAQSMDALSSMATIAGYKAVLLAATELPKMFPMMMTAAGTITPAKVFVIGAGVAGLQACATAKRLGAVTSAYDVRPAVREQVQSVGAKFIELELETAGAETAGGYAKEQGEDFLRRQREMMARVVADNDVVITTAAIPGKRSPILVTSEMVEGMAPGSVIVDLAAERGGNCELTKPGETHVHKGVKILGPLNIPSTVPADSSRMYSKNIITFLLHLAKGGEIDLQRDDEIIRETLVARDGKIVHARMLEILGQSAPSSPEAK